MESKQIESGSKLQKQKQVISKSPQFKKMKQPSGWLIGEKKEQLQKGISKLKSLKKKLSYKQKKEAFYGVPGALEKLEINEQKNLVGKATELLKKYQEEFEKRFNEIMQMGKSGENLTEEQEKLLDDLYNGTVYGRLRKKHGQYEEQQQQLPKDEQAPKDFEQFVTDLYIKTFIEKSKQNKTLEGLKRAGMIKQYTDQDKEQLIKHILKKHKIQPAKELSGIVEYKQEPVPIKNTSKTSKQSGLKFTPL